MDNTHESHENLASPGLDSLLIHFKRRLYIYIYRKFFEFPGLGMTASISSCSTTATSGQGHMSGDFRVCPDAYWAWDLRQIAVLHIVFKCQIYD